MKKGLKLLIMCVIILTIIFTSSIYSINKIKTGSESMISILKQLENNINSKNKELAISSVEEFQRIWDKEKVIWTAFISEEEINILDASSARLFVYIIEDDKVESLSEIAEIKNHLDHMPLIHSMAFSNIL